MSLMTTAGGLRKTRKRGAAGMRMHTKLTVPANLLLSMAKLFTVSEDGRPPTHDAEARDGQERRKLRYQRIQTQDGPSGGGESDPAGTAPGEPAGH